MSDDLKDISTRGAVVAIAVAVLGIALLLALVVFRGSDVVSKTPDKKRFQAVFLTNGDIYFGKIKDINSSFISLDNVYYIRAGGGASPSPSPGGANLQLVARGKEIHGPIGQMQISSQNVIFWENLKTDSKVVEGINNDKDKK